MKSIQHVDKAVCWVDTIDDAMQMPTTFRDEPDANIVSKLKSILLISVQAEALELVGKSPLGDCTVNTLMLKTLAARLDTVGVDT
ncbi:hypothetical protein PI124_g3708 [Phytophthora idaei]|nr:hypothetical protein PI124_g3708 [Phytophthora idaei]